MTATPLSARILERLDAVASAGDLVDFHARHKYLLMAHGPERLRALGRLVAAVGDAGFETTLQGYRAGLAAALAVTPTVGNHANALEHMAGYFDAPQRREFVALLADYRAGRATLTELLDTLAAWAGRLDRPYILGQHYLTDYRSV